MTVKTITTYIAAGYTLATKYNELIITRTGGVGGTGVTANASAFVFNYGKVNAGNPNIGVRLLAGGNVFNERGGSISGSIGVYLRDAGNVFNNGVIFGANGTGEDGYAVYLAAGGEVINGQHTIPTAVTYGDVVIGGGVGTVVNVATITGGGVELRDGGLVLNGTFEDTAAVIGVYGVELDGGGTVSNYGRIGGEVGLTGGGTVTNGEAGDTTAEIQGARGVEIYGAGIVTNFGAISGIGSFTDSYGVVLHDGGSLTNGTVIDRGALVQGYTGAKIFGGAGTVVNMATISGDGVVAGNQGLYLAGGSVTNGAAGDTAALIEGAGGVVLAGAGTILNFGAINGPITFGALLSGGGLVINGGGGDRSALISGAYGVKIAGGAATAGNYGTIQATGSIGVGLELDAGGLVVNGSLNNAVALIEGVIALDLSGASASATNFGVLAGTGDFGGEGALLNGGQTLTNGAAGHAGALIEGFQGVAAYGSANRVTNFGTISGAAGTAVRFNAAGDTLIVEAGCAFEGAVLGGGGTLLLDSGTGTLTGLLSAGGNVTVSGSMATTTFQDFDTILVGSAAQFTDAGAVTLAAGQSVVDGGSLTLGAAGAGSIVNAGLIEASGTGLLTLAGAVTNSGPLSVSDGTMTVIGAVTGKGHATIDGGTLDLASSFTQNVTFTKTGVLELAQSQGYTGTITGFSKTGGTSLDLVDIAFVGSGEATFSGTTASGVLTVTDGTHTAHINLKGNFTTAAFIASSDGHGGTTVVDPHAHPVAATHQFIAAMAGLTAMRAPGAIHVAQALTTGAPRLARPHTIAA